MQYKIGIRHEDKYLLERRVSLTPRDVEALIENHNLNIIVESSDKRVFVDAEFSAVGADVQSNIDNCDIIFGVKEIPIEKILPHKTYVMFSHVIKGQVYNMPMLRKLLSLNCSLIDYEKITDSEGRRLIFFGRFAGLAGMINTLWSLGQRYKKQGLITPFLHINQAHTYDSLQSAINDVNRTADEIKHNGLPDSILPFIVAFTGYGNVGKGAWEIFDLLPHKLITPDDIPNAKPEKHFLYKIIFKESDLVKRNSGEFELQHYYQNPTEYQNTFHKYLSYISCIVNGMYWDERYPRIVTKEKLKDLSSNNNLRLCVIGDISCDPDGSIECTHKGTLIEEPVYVYNPITKESTHGFSGDGILIMSVDILPSELPRESSESFSNVLKNFVPDIANADFNKAYEDIELVAPVKNALILLNGELTPNYEYLNDYL